MIRRTALVVAALLPLAGAPFALAQSAPAPKAPVVAVIDTGVNAAHQEFDYRGKTSTTDQFVAWWDFTPDKKPGQTAVLPKPGQLWDTTIANPYDDNGHGTLTAGMVGGRTASPQKTPAAAPGVKLAIAKVVNGGGSVNGSIADAIDWAVTTVHADVISISIGTIVPFPADLARDEFDAISRARKAGVLVVVANGNGFANAGVPGDPGWANDSSCSPDVLSVGASGVDGYLVSTDPELTAVFTVTGPSYKDRTSYVTESGTSFATPYVAGFASRLIGAARQAGRALPVGQLETLLQYSARDTTTPVQFEGYGVLDGSQLPGALSNAAKGTLPARPSPDLNATYVESVSGTLRTVWTTA
jgi:hypothetical protein